MIIYKNIGVKNLILFTLLLLFIYVIKADTNGIWNNAEDLRGGIIGEDEQIENMSYSFINPVYFFQKIYGSVNSSDYFINISGVNQFNIINSNIINSNLGNIYGNFYISKNLSLNSNKNCIGKLYTDSEGTIKCGVDNINDADYIIGNEFPLAGVGIITNDRIVSINTSFVQKRVSNFCPEGSSIRLIAEDGSVECESNSGGMTDVAHSFTSNGYQKFGNGFIIQWGISDPRTVYFPIEFPNNVLQVVATQTSSFGSYQNVGVASLTTSSFLLRGEDRVYYRWIAIGY